MITVLVTTAVLHLQDVHVRSSFSPFLNLFAMRSPIDAASFPIGRPNVNDLSSFELMGVNEEKQVHVSIR